MAVMAVKKKNSAVEIEVDKGQVGRRGDEGERNKEDGPLEGVQTQRF